MRSKEELIDIIRLAKLSDVLEDVDALYNDVTSLVDNVKLISDVDLSLYDCTEDVKISELREDVVVSSLPVDMILSDAAQKRDNFFIV